MPHPAAAYSFNELSISCCTLQVAPSDLLALINRARAWRITEARPMVHRLRGDATFDELRRGRQRDKIALMLSSTVNSPGRTAGDEIVLVDDTPALGFSTVFERGSWALSWPCACGAWREPAVVVTAIADGEQRPCRHAASETHLFVHWREASRRAKRQRGRPKSVLRVDDAQNSSAVEIPQVHFDDESALNIDGTWKHGSRALNRREREWLTSVGWLLPDPA